MALISATTHGVQATLGLNNSRKNLGDGADHRYRHAFAAEDLEATNAILSRKYAVVVGNPPYIAVKDRARYRHCTENGFRAFTENINSLPRSVNAFGPSRRVLMPQPGVVTLALSLETAS